MPAHPARIVLFIAVPVLFGMVGCCSGSIASFASPSRRLTKVSQNAHPLPHHVPRYPGNLTLRFAMVHDVIHERFPHHGPDYYRARNREVKQVIEKKRPTAKGKEADDYFRLLDDLGVGLAFLGKHSQAVDLLRDKLKQQLALGYKDKDLYSSYANLGTILILWQLGQGLDDAPRAKERIGESISWVRKAIEVYPQSHFGRERWQVVLEEFLLAAIDDPQLLLRHDMIGNRLDQPIDPASAVCFDEVKWLNPGIDRLPRGTSLAEQAETYLKGKSGEATDVAKFRQCITRVGGEKGWEKAKTSLDKPVPFDEPTLGIVGMWRMGAGANPHFALALGEIMLRVGQRYIAWTAYERAYRLRDHYWSDATIRRRFGEHCLARQRLIETGLPEEDWPAVRRRFEKELEHGQQFQREYQTYESKRIEEGASIEDPGFYDAFEKGRDPIASPVGNEDRTFTRREWVTSELSLFEPIAFCLLFAGLFAFVAAGIPVVFRMLRSNAPPGFREYTAPGALLHHPQGVPEVRGAAQEPRQG